MPTWAPIASATLLEIHYKLQQMWHRQQEGCGVSGVGCSEDGIGQSLELRPMQSS
ncbi:MAG: hypothetical protein KAF91_32505 [Nostoc sp. TH1S01]|nr:hypothetical protein [Nostoc sp. TH1S01]